MPVPWAVASPVRESPRKRRLSACATFGEAAGVSYPAKQGGHSARHSSWRTPIAAAMTVRLCAPLTERDWQAYHAIRFRVLFEMRGHGAAYDEQHPDERRPGHYPFLLWDGDTPVGVVRVDIDGTVATFRRVAIREDRQRRGYGRQLLSAAEAFARQQGCARIESFVDPGAIAFYERCGFSRTAAAEPGRATIPMARAPGDA